MGLQQMWSLLFAATCFLCFAYSKNVKTRSPTTIDASTATCCDFESSICGFTHDPNPAYSWWWTGDGAYPDLTHFPNFVNPTNYLWTENGYDGGTTSPSLVNITSDTQFGFNYYVNTDDIWTSLVVDLYNEDGVLLATMTSIQSSGDQWLYNTFTCGTKCCPSYPCNGFFVVYDAGDIQYTLNAIDNIEINHGCSLLTSASTPTEVTSASLETTVTALPPGSGCCQFTTDACGFSYRSPPQKGSWDWSGAGNTPNITLFPLFPGDDGSYLFTQNDDESVTYSSDVTVEAATKIGLKYYAHIEDTTGYSSLRVYFDNSDGTLTLLEVLDDTDENWRYQSLTCGSHECCESYPCTGKIKMVADVTSLNELFAIDEVEINNACSDTLI